MDSATVRIRYRDEGGEVGWHRLRPTGAREDAGTWLLLAEEPDTGAPLELALADVLGWQSAPQEVAAAADRPSDRPSSDKSSADRLSADAPVPGVYRHHKGSFYWLLEVATHSETREPMAVYRCLYGDFSTWVRPWAMFTETVLVDGIEVPRFAYVAPLA